MAVRRVLQMGEPLLKQVAQPVERFDRAARRTSWPTWTTPCAPRAAPASPPRRSGSRQRVVIFELKDNPRYPHIKPVPYTVLVNPTLTPLTEEQDEGWEGCLSVPGMRGLVPRFTRLRYQGFDAAGRSASIAPWRASMRAWCSTRSITWMESSSRSGSGTCETSASRTCLPAR